MRLTIDMETRSAVDLKKCGVYVYAEDASTDILCIAVKVDDEPCFLWSSKLIRVEGVYFISDFQLREVMKEATEIHAHNANFERILWREVMHKKYGFEDVPFEKWRCTAAKVASYALPRSLGMAAKAIGAREQKDYDGYRIMLKMCKPRKPTKKNPNTWHEDQADFIKLCEYCAQDVESEYDIDAALYDLPAQELKVWQLDQRINDRGVKVDSEAIDNLIFKVQAKERKLLLEIQQITNGVINSVKQVAATRKWLKTRGLDLPDLQKQTVEDALCDASLDPKVRRLLEIRQSLSKSSVSKLDAMRRRTCKDGRVRGSILYHGASTGRFSGKGIQPQNYPRDSISGAEIEALINLGVEEVDEKYGCTIQAASKCLRGMIRADEGHELVCADFASIEARVLAWLAGEHNVLKAFRQNLDLYKVAASDIYRQPYDIITKEQRQIGKVAVLALGYQGWIGAFNSMAGGYGVVVPEEQAKEIILNWRDAHPNIVKFWGAVEEAAIKAVLTGNPHSYGRIKFGIRGDFLHCRLPNGRLLSYYNPGTEQITTKWGTTKTVVSFWGMDSYTNKWCKQYTYGGKLTENIVQAVARDLLCEAMLRLEDAKFDIVLHIHDEVLAEVPTGKNVLEDFEKIMAEVPEWAQGCPLGAEGWLGKRYRKE